MIGLRMRHTLKISFYNRNLTVFRNNFSDDVVMSSHHVWPKAISAVEGESVTFICVSAGLTQWWFYRSHGLPSNAVVSGNDGEFLTIHNTTISNNGKYSCFGKFSGQEIYFISSSYLRVHG